MKVKIEQSTAKGNIKVPPSKSMAHRFIICAALSNGVSEITNVDYSEDIKATLDCIRALGAKVEENESSVIIDGRDSLINDMSDKVDGKIIEFKCRESGSTMRFFMGIAMTLPMTGRFYGSETLRNRPFGIYESILEEQKLLFERKEDFIEINGPIKSSEYSIKGNISSQFVTGLLFALSLKKEGGKINLIPPVESRSYINMTIQAMRKFGIDVDWDNENTLIVKPSQEYIAKSFEVEGDYSNAAFLDAFNYIGGDVNTEGLNAESLQGNKVYKECFEKLKQGKATIDIADCPDLGPVLFAVAAANHGGIFTSTARLKIKESDRGSVMCEELSKFGVITDMQENTIVIEGNGLKKPVEELCGHNDHRIVMSLSLLLTITGGTVNEAEAVRKSYPHFFEDIQKLGISLTAD